MEDRDDDIMTCLSLTFSSNLMNSQNSEVREMETFKSLSLFINWTMLNVNQKRLLVIVDRLWKDYAPKIKKIRIKWDEKIGIINELQMNLFLLFFKTGKKGWILRFLLFLPLL